MSSADQPIRYYRYSTASGWRAEDARVITEHTVSLTVNGEVWMSFTCTPTDLEPLAAGFLFNEGIIQKKDEIASIYTCKQETNVDIWLHRTVQRPDQWRRTSGCTGGVTAVQAVDEEEALPPISIPQIHSDTRFAPAQLLGGMDQLLQTQDIYREAGGIHSSALSDGEKLLVRVEDIGRHNTLDKIAGRMLLEDIHTDHGIILTTGRVSSEMMQKCARLGALVVVSRTSPTSQSIALAERAGITLVGYARRSQFFVYTHTERIIETANSPAPTDG